MTAHKARTGLLLTCGVALLIAIVSVVRPSNVPLPDFSDLGPKERKAAFFEYLAPLIAQVNGRSLQDRAAVAALAARAESQDRLSWIDRRELAALAQKYEIETHERSDADVVADLQRRTGVVPASLVLIQAAKESGWGTSRFATEGNNLFGQRCYDDDCGIAPRGRTDPSFGLASFDSIEESIESYVLNLNTHPKYQRFRELRVQLREQNKPLRGLDLALGLLGYSERGHAYVEEVRSMIRQNNLE